MKSFLLIASLESLALAANLVHRQDRCNKNNCYNDVWPNPNQIARGVTDCLSHLITTISINPVQVSQESTLVYALTNHIALHARYLRQLPLPRPLTALLSQLAYLPAILQHRVQQQR